MSIFKLVGYLVAALGLFCGILLLLSPINEMSAYGLALSGKTLTLSVLFVLLSAMGVVLAGFGAGGKDAVDKLSLLVGGAWLLLGVLAILALVLDLVGVISASLTLTWWVMAIACVASGAVGVMMGSKTGSSTKEA